MILIRKIRNWLKETAIGPCTLALVLTRGLYIAIGAARGPLASAIAMLVNLLIRKFHSQLFPITVPAFVWQTTVFLMLAAFMLIAVSLAVGSWLYPKT